MTTTLIPAPALMTLDGLSEYLQTPKKTIYHWRTRGGGPRALKLGGQLRFRATDVEAWLDQQAEAAA